MSELTPAQQHVMDEAARVNEERMAAVEELAKAVARRVDLEHELNEAKKEEKRLMIAAEKQGWTRTQVNRFAKPPKTTRRNEESSSEQRQSRVEQSHRTDSTHENVS